MNRRVPQHRGGKTRQRGGLADPRGSGGQDQAAGGHQEVLDGLRQTDLVELGNPGRDQAQGGPRPGAIEVGVQSEAAQVADLQGRVQLVVELPFLAACVVQKRKDQLSNVQGGNRLTTGNRLEAPPPPQHGRQTGLEVEIGSCQVDRVPKKGRRVEGGTGHGRTGCRLQGGHETPLTPESGAGWDVARAQVAPSEEGAAGPGLESFPLRAAGSCPGAFSPRPAAFLPLPRAGGGRHPARRGPRVPLPGGAGRARPGIPGTRRPGPVAGPGPGGLPTR